MEKGLGEFIKWIRTGPSSLGASLREVVNSSRQPTSGESQHKYKKPVLLLGGTCLNTRNVAPEVPEVTAKEAQQS